MIFPSLKRRLACMLYEGVLLFGVIFIAAWLFDTLTQSRHALYLRHVRQAWLFVVLGIYFIYFWCKSGQTLAMKTWRIRLVKCAKKDGAHPQAPLQLVNLKLALGRYLLIWIGCVPGLAIAQFFKLSMQISLVFVAVNILFIAVTMFFDPARQFIYDRLLGTRLISS